MLPPRVTRLFLFLEQFDFTIEHVKGKDNPVADALSRFNKSIIQNSRNFAGDPSVNLFNYNSDSELNQLMRKLPSLQSSGSYLNQLLLRKSKRLRFRNNFYEYQGSDMNYRMYIPSIIQNRLLQHYHLFYGHILRCGCNANAVSRYLNHFELQIC